MIAQAEKASRNGRKRAPNCSAKAKGKVKVVNEHRHGKTRDSLHVLIDLIPDEDVMRTARQLHHVSVYRPTPAAEFENRTRTSDGVTSPRCWAESLMVFDAKTVHPGEPALGYLSAEQVGHATRLLDEGFVVGLNTSRMETPTIVLEFRDLVGGPLVAVQDAAESDCVYFTRSVPDVDGDGRIK